ncbi:DUF7158 domain-containing protein [Actinosynnema sp. CS-041913]|uniref:DUF7158 domain-containing protein n=1 Tax=Actinosynnema sp. CS-041913 TaxID=3239917 RepID=UPI003D8E7BCE
MTGLSKLEAATAQREATVIGWIDGAPVPRALLDARLALLRTRPGALPRPGTGENRQLIRWTAHVLFTEELCRREATAPALRPATLDPVAAVQLGSINAAAWQSCPEVAAVFEAVTSAPPADPTPHSTRRWWRVSLGSAPTATPPPALTPIGWTTLDDLPATLATHLRTARPGRQVGPVMADDQWHIAVVEEIADRPADVGRLSRAAHGTRLREFSRWLDHRRAHLLRPAPGFEHPGDPDQPDYTHRH